MNGLTLVLTVGISGSGKTSWAEEYTSNRKDWVNLNRDDVRFNTFCNGERDWNKYKFTNKNEKRVTDIITGYAEECYAQGLNIIISDTNLSSSIRNKWREWGKSHGYTVIHKEFPLSWIEAVKRNNQREGGISQSVLRSQYYKMKKYLGEYIYEPNPELPDCVLIDIDGTVAYKAPGRGFFDWDMVDKDIPRTPVIAMVCGLIDQGYQPIFLSGRDGSCMEATYDWIYKHIMHYLYPDCDFHLFMRTGGDMRKDYIVKRELFDTYVKDKFNVVAVLDDRPAVINNCWLDMGLPNVISCADQNLEF